MRSRHNMTLALMLTNLQAVQAKWNAIRVTSKGSHARNDMQVKWSLAMDLWHTHSLQTHFS
jgi:hypothetical protein